MKKNLIKLMAMLCKNNLERHDNFPSASDAPGWG